MDDDKFPQRLFTTPGGMVRLRERLVQVRAAWFAVCASNEDAAGSGDSSVWHDNFAYEENQRQMHLLARRVRELESSLDRMEVVPTFATAPKTVRLGAGVSLSFLDEDQEMTFLVAGFEDGNPAENRVSYTSPLARAVLGARPGEVRQVRIGSRIRDVEILRILPWSEEVRP